MSSAVGDRVGLDQPMCPHFVAADAPMAAAPVPSRGTKDNSLAPIRLRSGQAFRLLGMTNLILQAHRWFAGPCTTQVNLSAIGGSVALRSDDSPPWRPSPLSALAVLQGGRMTEAWRRNTLKGAMAITTLPGHESRWIPSFTHFAVVSLRRRSARTSNRFGWRRFTAPLRTTWQTRRRSMPIWLPKTRSGRRESATANRCQPIFAND